MPIEFRCTQCNKLLRTPDETAGKQAQCPECGAILAIPSAAAPPSESSSPAPQPPDDSPFGAVPPPPPPGAEPGSPFAPGGPQPSGAGDPDNPYRSPADYGPAPAAAYQPGGFAPTPIDVGDVFARTWEIFKDQWGMCLITVLVATGLNIAAIFLEGIAGGVVQAVSGNEVLVVMVNLFSKLARTLFSIWLGIGQALIFLNLARGREVSIGDLFTGGPYFVTVLLASLLFTLICLVGYVALIVPGIILALMFSQFYYLILDRNVGIMESLNLSKQITTGNKMTLFAIGLLGGLLVIVAILPCGLGLIVAVPFITLMWPVVYLAMTGQPTADRLRPAS